MRPTLFALCLVVVFACGASAELCGDVTGDGAVNVLDALSTARGVVGLVVLTPTQERVADVNSSGSVDVLDALQIARFGAGLGATLTCAPPPPPGVGWREVTLGAQRPSPRCEHSAALDSLRNRTLLFAGNFVGPGGVTGPANDYWAFDLASETWSELHPTGTPASGSNVWNLHEDVARNRMIGHSMTGGAVFLLDFASRPDGVWGTFTTTGAAPTAIMQAGGYHPVQDALIVAGDGQLHALSFGGGTTASWQQLALTGDPVPLIAWVFQAELLYDPIADRCLFTVRDAVAADMAVYEIRPDVAGGTAAVRRLTPTGQSSLPSAEHHAVFDAAGNRVIFSQRSWYTDPSILDLSTGGDGAWTTPPPAAGPGWRAHGALCADGQGRLVLQGGMAIGALFEDTWVFE